MCLDEAEHINKLFRLSCNNENSLLFISIPPRQGDGLEHYYWFHLTPMIRSTLALSANHQPRLPPSTTMTNESRRNKCCTGSFFSKSVVAAGKIMTLLRCSVRLPTCLCRSVSTACFRHTSCRVSRDFSPFECWNQGRKYVVWSL